MAAGSARRIGRAGLIGPEGVRITVPPAGVAATGPIVVLVHGGAWVAGEPALMDDWAAALAATGAVVFNASYRLLFQPGGGYPGSVDDVACAVRYARAMNTTEHLTPSRELVIMGHSAGGHLAAVVALDEDAYAADWPYPRSAARRRRTSGARLTPWNSPPCAPTSTSRSSSAERTTSSARASPRLRGGPTIRSRYRHGRARRHP